MTKEQLRSDFEFAKSIIYIGPTGNDATSYKLKILSYMLYYIKNWQIRNGAAPYLRKKPTIFMSQKLVVQ